MKLNRDIHYPSSTHQDQWEKLKQFTDARIALGRAGCSIPTHALLEFQLSHAQAKDAVYQTLDVSYLTEQLTQRQLQSVHVQSNAPNKEIYLKCPDLGRQLSTPSKDALSKKYAENPKLYDVCIVVGDGLSARAIEANAIPFITELNEQIQQENWNLAPIVLATGSRVALGDEVAEIFKASMLVMLIGERPGLSSPDSMGIYYTWNAYSGCLDAKRNCISNVRSAGLSIPVAAQRLMALMKKSKQLGFSGVNLKDEHQLSDIGFEPTQKLLF
ncbi:ethanolamine ammonia-lyase subunit EutC [Acinetobacter lactucae]|uniref:Ethanolamine ammonia-lyase small subunit n=1 Tax=Acinetobacter lactucae TaxID=1785128 RepID=A0A429JTD7_9GAMM|nr:ethanolamine ammonia-lyase subunit EutC [Acinetobacter lactucae]RSO52581.1 ethanolamine ammonia-lyase subunit EutC [Acinetobacter lactucae]